MQHHIDVAIDLCIGLYKGMFSLYTLLLTSAYFGFGAFLVGLRNAGVQGSYPNRLSGGILYRLALRRVDALNSRTDARRNHL